MIDLLEWINLKGDQENLYLVALWGEALHEAGRYEEAHVLFRKILDRLPDFSDDPQKVEMNYIGRAHLGLGDLAAMQRTIDAGVQRFPDDAYVYYQASCLYSLAGQEQKALDWLEQALKKGFNNVRLARADVDLINVRQSPGFEALLKKYFPEEYKD